MADHADPDLNSQRDVTRGRVPLFLDWSPMRVHLLALPNAPTTAACYLDGFAQMTRRFAEILRRLDIPTLLYYAGANDAPCTTAHCCLSEDDRQRTIGATPYQAVNFNAAELYVRFNAAANYQIARSKQPGDVIATLAGEGAQPVFQQHPELTALEYSIGYRGVCAPFRVYQSHTWRATVHGYTGMDLGREFDAVIPPGFDVTAFPEATQPEPYVVYCGRVNAIKGVPIACAAAEAAGVPLYVIGHGDPSVVTYGTYLGAVDDATRNDLLAKATACLMPTRYLEPFGNVSAEAQLCGTPVIGPDFGAFVETIDHGRSGFRCATTAEYAEAIARCGSLDRSAIRARAQQLWSLETATEAYRSYFARLAVARAA